MYDYLKNLDLSDRGVIILWGVSLLILLIFLIILARRISESILASVENNGRINQYLAAVPADRIGTINAVYQNTRKHLSAAMILCIIGGSFGFQRIYLGKKSSAISMFLFFWTGIPSIGCDA